MIISSCTVNQQGQNMLQLRLSISCPLICQAKILLTTNAILYPPDHHDAERNCVARRMGRLLGTRRCRSSVRRALGPADGGLV